MCHVVRNFALVLADAGVVSKSPTSVYLWDERFTSAQANAMLDRHGGGMSKKVDIDSLSAGLILQHYFDAGGVGAEKVSALYCLGDGFSWEAVDTTCMSGILVTSSADCIHKTNPTNQIQRLSPKRQEFPFVVANGLRDSTQR